MAVVFLQDQGIPRADVEAKLAAVGLRALWQATADDAPLAPEDIAAVTSVVTVNKPVTAAILAAYANTKVLAVAFTGYGVHDLDACKAAGVAVCNVPDYSSSSVAELALGLTLAVFREIPAGDAMVRGGGWGLGAGTELKGKTVGIAGTGTIGCHVARLFAAFGCTLVGWSRSESDAFKALGGTYVTKEQLFSTSDVLSVHIANNAETFKMIGRADLERLKATSVLINTARGQVIDEEALSEMLMAKKFRAGLDVYHAEAAPAWASQVGESAILMPHVAYKTQEALARRADITIANIQAALGGAPVNRVA